MTIRTELSKSEIQSAMDACGLGIVRTWQGIAAGSENSNYFVETSDGRFVLTLLEGRTDTSAVPWTLGLMKHLRLHDVPVPKIIGTADINSRKAVIAEFLEGSSRTKPDNEDCYKVGAMLARMHQFGRSSDVRFDPHTGPAAWRSMMAGIDGVPDVIAGNFRRIDELWPSGYMQRGAIHGDLFPDNVLFQGTRISGVLDFWLSATGWFAYDLAVTINAWAGTETPKHEAVLEGYRTLRQLDAAETDAMPVLLAGAALRFALSRLQDAGPASEPDPDLLVQPVSKNPAEFVDLFASRVAALS